MSLKPVAGVLLGSDPELFIEQCGKVVGAEKVVPEAGLKPGNAKVPTVILDGVQVELNPPAANSTLLLGRGIGTALEMLQKVIEKKDLGYSISFRDFVDVGRAELDSLGPKTRELGCLPSKNIYGERVMTIDPKTYTKRSTGGHLHFGLQPKLKRIQTDLIPEFDIFVGNMAVLFDRSLFAAERRENYGRAGEYREPAYGVEYRTLSNFWLRNYTLMSMVFGLSQIALSVVNSGNLEEELIATVDIHKVIKAIDTNNFDLAMENFETVRPFLAKHLPATGFCLNPDSLDRFVVLAKGVRDKGLEAFFPAEPVAHWIGLTKGEKAVEFNEFLTKVF